ncbi:unnamed protein product [Prorocentrum cordatum]|uniref:Nuclear pore complex protein Nup85 n=1 Tax=Prorocentrum cordatum TaxID=2364126 RepID=A0ABN9VE01_9DINO|nr:unnamed protein product [Polarella glacialis]
MASAALASQGEPWRSREVAAASSLAHMVRWVPLQQDGTPDLESAPGRSAMSRLLSMLELVGQELGAERAARDYRSAVAEHHRARWLQQGFLYSLEVLAKCNEGQSEVVVNGRAFHMSRKTARLTGWVRRRWCEVFALLRQMRKRPAEAWDALLKVSLSEALSALDHAWASFEERFFAELRLYEVQAQDSADLVRGFRSTAAAARDGGAQGEASCYESSCCWQLVDHISMLNLVHNPGRTGRIFSAGVLIVSEMVVRSSQPLVPHQQDAVFDPGCLIASCAIEAFDNLCDFILESADGGTAGQHSSAGLVEVLSAWESSWELAVTYVADEGNLRALRALVACTRQAHAVSPRLAALCDDHDPEAFLVLPRIVWLCFLEGQPGVASLLAPLLPPHGAEEVRALQRELRGLAALLAGASAEGEGAGAAAPAAGRGRALVGAAVRGPGGDFADLGLAEGTEELLRGVLRTAEGWSLELQRHRAEGWNHLCAVLLWCLAARRLGAERGGQ